MDNTFQLNSYTLALTLTGSDNLWAGLIQQLYVAVENHHGSDFTFAERLAKLHWTIFKVIFFALVFSGAYKYIF